MELAAEAILRAVDLGRMDRARQLRERTLRELAGSNRLIDVFERMILEGFAERLADAQIANDDVTAERVKSAVVDLLVLDDE